MRLKTWEVLSDDVRTYWRKICSRVQNERHWYESSLLCPSGSHFLRVFVSSSFRARGK